MFNGPYGTLQLAALPIARITGFAPGDTIVLDQTVTGLAVKYAGARTAILTLTNGTATVGTLDLTGIYRSGDLAFHLDVAPNGDSATISLQTIGIAMPQPTPIVGTAAIDVLQVTANGQTLTGLGGLGGNDTLDGGSVSGLDFKDLTANLSGSSIQDFATSDTIDFTDMNAATATVSYNGSVLTASDGTHSATLSLGFLTTPASRGFMVAGDGASGTIVFWH